MGGSVARMVKEGGVPGTATDQADGDSVKGVCAETAEKDE